MNPSQANGIDHIGRRPSRAFTRRRNIQNSPPWPIRNNQGNRGRNRLPLLRLRELCLWSITRRYVFLSLSGSLFLFALKRTEELTTVVLFS